MTPSETPTGPSAQIRALADVYEHYETDDSVRRRWSHDNPGNQAILDELIRVASGMIELAGYAPSHDILDLGCGRGTWLTDLLRPGTVTGIDLLFERLVAAQARTNANGLVCADGSALPFHDRQFDTVVVSTVLSSVGSEDVRVGIATEIERVLRPGGFVMFYDFRVRNPFNPQTRPVTRRQLDSLFAGFDQLIVPVTVVPQVVRRLGPLTKLAYRTLSRVPGARSHLLGLFRKR